MLSARLVLGNSTASAFSHAVRPICDLRNNYRQYYTTIDKLADYQWRWIGRALSSLISNGYVQSLEIGGLHGSCQ